jgi:transcriptional regulator with XRE-family HTH domain
MLKMGERIKIRRFVLMLSTKNIADLIGIEENRIFKWEEDIESPSEQELLALAKHLQCATGFLIYGLSNPNKITKKSPD